MFAKVVKRDRSALASVFVRGENGEPMANPPLPWNIELSRTLARLPLIAEAWDARGLYHVGAFPGLSWTEWNGRYRDIIRRFLRGDRGMTGEVASCIAGSSELYAHDGRLPSSPKNRDNIADSPGRACKRHRSLSL